MRMAQSAVQSAGWTDLRTQTFWMCALIMVVAGLLRPMATSATEGSFYFLFGAAVLLTAVMWLRRQA